MARSHCKPIRLAFVIPFALGACSGSQPDSSTRTVGLSTDPASAGDGGGTAASGAAVVIARVAAGASAPYTDSLGHVWSADTGFIGGLSDVASGQGVQGTSDAPLYDGQRYADSSGSFQYSFAAPAGTYNVTLKFTENYVTGPGQRLFGVSINGASVLSKFDIYAESGGQWSAVDKTFPVTLAAAGSIDIAFTAGSAQSAKVDAIAIEGLGASQPDAGVPSGPGTGSVGPASSSTFVSVDFTNMTSPAGVANVVVAPQLFGASTGGLADNTFGGLGNATTRALIKALNLPLLRVNANANLHDGSSVAPLVQHADIFPSNSTWVFGVDNPAAASAVASYVKSSSAIPVKLWEVHNETQPGQSSSSYNADALAIASAIKAVDSSYRIAGDQSAGLDIGDLKALVDATDATKLGLLDYHDYLYCNDGNNAPSDEDICFARYGGTDRFAEDQAAVQSAVKGTFAASLPVFLGEYNDECSASFNDLRAGTSMGAAFMVSATLGMAAVSTQPVWSAVWDLDSDGGANYNLIDPNNNIFPQYYTLQRLIATMPGDMVSTNAGSAASGVRAWATKTGAHFGLAIVNSNGGSVSGPIALSHWPVNASGSGTATLWTYPQVGGMTSPVANQPGVTSSVAVTAGVTGTITVPGHSVVILSSP